MDYCVKCGSIYTSYEHAKGQKMYVQCNECSFEGNASKFEWLARLKFMLGRGGWITSFPPIIINMETEEAILKRTQLRGIDV